MEEQRQYLLAVITIQYTYSTHCVVVPLWVIKFGVVELDLCLSEPRHVQRAPEPRPRTIDTNLTFERLSGVGVGSFLRSRNDGADVVQRLSSVSRNRGTESRTGCTMNRFMCGP